MDYATLIADKSVAGSIRYSVNYALLDVVSIVQEAQAKIFRRLRVREMRMTAAIALAQGAGFAPLPTGFLDPISLRTKHGTPIGLVTVDVLDRLRVVDGETNSLVQGHPFKYAISDEQLQFDRAASEALTYTLRYFAPTYISADLTTSFLTTRYPDLLRSACLERAYEERKEMDQVTYYGAKVASIMGELEANDDLTLRGFSDPLNEG